MKNYCKRIGINRRLTIYLTRQGRYTIINNTKPTFEEKT